MLDALNVSPSDADLRRIEDAVPRNAATGTRYDEAQMQRFDSEPSCFPQQRVVRMFGSMGLF